MPSQKTQRVGERRGEIGGETTKEYCWVQMEGRKIITERNGGGQGEEKTQMSCPLIKFPKLSIGCTHSPQPLSPRERNEEMVFWFGSSMDFPLENVDWFLGG